MDIFNLFLVSFIVLIFSCWGDEDGLLSYLLLILLILNDDADYENGSTFDFILLKFFIDLFFIFFYLSLRLYREC